MWSLRCCFCCEDEAELYQQIVTQNTDDDEVIANQEVVTEDEYHSVDSHRIDSSVSEFKTPCSKSSESPDGPVSDENAPFQTDNSYCINTNENVRKIPDVGIEKIKFINENDVRFPEYYGPENFFSADFSRWLRNGNLYIKPTLSYNTDGILKITEYLDDYQEFELFAAKKPSNVNNETTLNTGAKPKIRYAQALKDSNSGPSSISNSKKNKKKKKRAMNRNQGSTYPVAIVGVHNQSSEEVRTNLNQIPSQPNHDMLNKEDKKLVAVIKSTHNQCYEVVGTNSTPTLLQNNPGKVNDRCKNVVGIREPTQNQDPEAVRTNFLQTKQTPSQNNYDMLNKRGKNLVALIKPTQNQGPDIVETNLAPSPLRNDYCGVHNKKGVHKYMHNVTIIKHIDNGFTFDKKVYIPSKNWHAVVDRETDKFCLLCGVIYYDEHIYEEYHLSQLEKSISRILNKGWNIVRELKENTFYHCGICNVVLESEQKVNIHIFNEQHRQKYYQSRDKCTRLMKNK